MPGDPLVIRPMGREDVQGCLAVIAEAWSPHTAELARPELTQAFMPGWPPIFYVARAADRIVGMAGYMISGLNYGVYSLLYVSTLKAHRRRGVATALIARCLDDTDVLDANVMLTTDVPDLYRPFGFEILDADLICAGKPQALMRRRCQSDPARAAQEIAAHA